MECEQLSHLREGPWLIIQPLSSFLQYTHIHIFRDVEIQHTRTLHDEERPQYTLSIETGKNVTHTVCETCHHSLLLIKQISPVLQNLLFSAGAVQDINGAECKRGTQQCMPPSPLLSSLLLSFPTSCLTSVSPPPLCSGWLSEDPPSPLNSNTGTPQRSNFELLPTMKYLPHRGGIFSQCRTECWHKGTRWKRNILKLNLGPLDHDTANKHDYAVCILLNVAIFV